MSIESARDRLVVQGGSLVSKTPLTLDKKAGRASVENSILMWRGKPHVLTFKDGLSCADTHKPALRTHAGEMIGVPSGETTPCRDYAKLREFLGIGAQGV